MNWGHPRKNPSKKFGCDTSCKFVTRLGKDLQYSPSLVPACTWSRSNFSDEVFFLGCRNLWMVCVKIRRCIKGGSVPLASAPAPALIVVPFGNTDKTHPGRVLRYPHCGCSDAAPAKPCKANAAAMLAWLWLSRRGFCNARLSPPAQMLQKCNVFPQRHLLTAE